MIVKAISLVLIVIVFLVLWGWLKHRGYPSYPYMKIVHLGTGIALVLTVFWFNSPIIPLAIMGGFLAFFLFCRYCLKQRLFIMKGRLADIYGVVGCLVSVGIGWGILKDPYLGITPALMFSWGDCVTGFTRWPIYHKRCKGNWGSLTMLAVCLAIGIFLIKPFWVGILGAIAAVLTEKYSQLEGIWDDNLTIPFATMTVIYPLCLIFG